MDIVEYYEYVKDNCIGVFKTGSCVLPYIKYYRDCDYIFLYDTKEHSIEARNKFYEKYSRLELSKEDKIDIHFQYLDIFYKYNKWGFGKDMEVIIDKSHIKDTILGILEDKEHFIKIIKDTIEENKYMCKKSPKINFYTRKTWYYIYRIYSILKNNSYVLTDEQIYNINMLHSREGDSTQRKTLIDTMIKEIDLWRI